MDTFAALADPTRRSIVELLATRGSLSTGDITKNFHISQPAVSQHLKVLRDADVVVMEKRAQMHLYAINQEKLEEIQEWVQRQTRRWNARLDRLEEVLRKEQGKTSPIRKGK